MTTLYGVLADLTVVLHLAFVGFVALGGFAVIRWHWLAWAHIPAIVWAVLLEWMNLVCPLTPWELHLRELAGHPGYEGGFITHYLLPLLYPPSLTRPVQILLGAFVIAINLAVYGRLWYRRRR